MAESLTPRRSRPTPRWSLPISLFLIAGCSAVYGQPELETLYARPGELDLPVELIGQLERAHCLIPRSSYGNLSVIEGEFASAGQKDRAVLCSADGTSHIQLFWGGSHSCPSKLAFLEDAVFLSKNGDGEWRYHRILAAAGADYILEHHERYGGPQPPPITHDGIDDGFAEKGSTIHYCHEGHWIELTGAD